LPSTTKRFFIIYSLTLYIVDSDLYLNRAENEIKLARIVFAVSKDQSMQVEVFGEKYPDTYYSAVITHSYYAIFYAAKAYLLTKGVVITPPEEHRKTYDALKGRVDSGELDVDLDSGIAAGVDDLARGDGSDGGVHADKVKWATVARLTPVTTRGCVTTAACGLAERWAGNAEPVE